MENINPNVFRKTESRQITAQDLDESIVDPIDQREVFGEYQLLSIKGEFFNFG